MAARGTEPSPFFTNMKSAPRAATLFIYRREWARCRQPHICKDTVTIQFSIKDTPVHITHTFHPTTQYRHTHTQNLPDAHVRREGVSSELERDRG